MEAELLAAVLAAPDDDAPRLVYADWLQERGDPRGELIHLGCRLAGMPAGPERDLLVKREFQLRIAHAQDWKTALGSRGQLTTVRGFPEVVHYMGPDAVDKFVAEADRLLRRIPLRRVIFTSPSLSVHTQDGPDPVDQQQPFAAAQLAALAGAPQLAAIRELELFGCDEAVGDDVLAASPHPTALETLAAHAAFSPAGLSALGRSQYVERLRVLDLSQSYRLGANGMQALAMTHGLPAVHTLDLSRCYLEPEAVAVLADHVGLASLRTLLLRNTNVGAVGVAALAQAAQTAKLATLDLAWSQIGEAGAQALAASRYVEGLALGVLAADVGVAGLSALAASPRLGGLTVEHTSPDELPRPVRAALAARYGARLTWIRWDRGRPAPVVY